MRITNDLNLIITALRQGDVIAYPTEGVFGLGCDPFNEMAVQKLLAIKQRRPEKGLILVADCWGAVADLTAPIDETRLAQALSTWPGAVTWVFPAASTVPEWITGHFSSVALRVSKHPVIKAICEAFGGPIVSTSANREGAPPARDVVTLENYFLDIEDLLLYVGELGGAERPTPIKDVITGVEIRG